MKTIQLRRYRMIPELVDAYFEWWNTLCVPAREAAGFTVESAYFVPETNEFIWAVSVPGDREELEAVDAAWMASPKRAEIFAGRPTWTTEMIISIVESKP